MTPTDATVITRGELLLAIATLRPDPGWRTQARCNDRTDLLGYRNADRCDQAYGAYGTIARNAFKRDYCAKCPVIAHCLREGLTEPHGVWGGMGSCERHDLYRSLK